MSRDVYGRYYSLGQEDTSESPNLLTLAHTRSTKQVEKGDNFTGP